MHGGGGHDPEVLKELRTAPDLATSDEGYGTVSRSCDVHTCGPGAPPLGVSGWHRDVDKVWFLKVPVSQTGLFGDATGNMAQQFPAAQEQTEAI